MLVFVAFSGPRFKGMPSPLARRTDAPSEPPDTSIPPGKLSAALQVGFNFAPNEPGAGVVWPGAHIGTSLLLLPADWLCGRVCDPVAETSATPGARNDVPHAPVTMIPSKGCQSNATFGFVVTPNV